MSMRIPFCDQWLFHEGDIEVTPPAVKGPVYMRTKTEGELRGPASIYYGDRPDDYKKSGKEVTHERWDWVTLPHDYIIKQEPKETGNNALGFFTYPNAWYRKHFTVDPEWKGKRIELEFCGVTTTCKVYVNGVYLASHETAFTPFTVDISDVVRFDGENVVAVFVSPERPEGWWYPGAGITRKVWLSVKNPLAVARYGVYVAPERKADTLWSVPVEVTVENTSFTDTEAEVHVEILSPEGASVVTAQTAVCVDARDTAEVTLHLPVTSPRLWDVDAPTLYTVKTEIRNYGTVTDTEYTEFGFRYFEFTKDNGFFLNGKKTFIYGVCSHEGFALTGRAVPDNVMRHQVRMIKEMGANGYRCSHYMFDEELMNAFDRQGLLVMAETRHFSPSETHLEELRTLVKRDRNRPSVILWSIGNEEPYFIREEGRRIAETMRHEVRKLDRTRPIMTANDKKPEICTVYDTSDIVAINYNLPIYETVREQIPNKAFLSSECCATGTTRGWYYEDSPEKAYISAYDKDTNNWFLGREKTYRFFREHPYIAGAFQWAAIEHRGEAMWPRVCSQSGAIDLFLQRKDAFYQNRSMWTQEPMIHLLPHWNMEGHGSEPIRVWAYTNCASAELFLNGKSLGVCAIEPCGHGEWFVPFEKGELLARGYDEDGTTVCECRRVTAGKSAALALRLENPDDVHANGEDLALYTCFVVDENGNEVPTAAPTVSFSTNGLGTVIGTGSDICDHTPVTATVRRMRAGRILIAVKVKKTAGTLRLYAESDGLTPTAHEFSLSEE
ncbi:MAG: DUF4982 domain-containing protein [Clostridia bacterium]|nr:DUF4982 domain-containing protein [Clostridia bacterium]